MIVVAESAGRAERTVEILHDYDIIAIPVERSEDAHAAAVLVTRGTLSKGFWLEEASLQVYAETDVFEEERRAPEQRRNLARTFLSDLRDLKVGDLVVHVDHGIGEFVGLKQLATGTRSASRVGIRYPGVPRAALSRRRQVVRPRRAARSHSEVHGWLSTGTRSAGRHDLGEGQDARQEGDARHGRGTPQAVRAAEGRAGTCLPAGHPLAGRIRGGISIRAHARPGHGDRRCEARHGGQYAHGSLAVRRRGIWQDRGGDARRLQGRPGWEAGCVSRAHDGPRVSAFEDAAGSVRGFPGCRSTWSAVSARSRRRRRCSSGSRPGESTSSSARTGCLSKDVQFKDLGLLVVDEEQRFGVVHKERIKQMRKRVDVLTMTATPIPRTLNMSLVGIRDMSIIETPPKDRLSIQTNVVKFDAPVIERAIRSELARGGQIYFVHNRVESIFSIGNLLQRLVPEARMAIGHGQMGEEELERAMLGFVERRFDILLATTIVENGLDIPNANTIIINRADRYGLAQLYQLRGRVGRSDRAAYAYLLIPPQESLSPVARKRLAAIKEFSDLGSGFRVAALDLEIRGAGNLLGGEQSGHIDTVGFEMYMKLLEETIRELRGEELEDDARATVNLRIDLKIDPGYIQDMNQRLMVYRKVASPGPSRSWHDRPGGVA